MILMALDHVRDFMGTPGISPTNLAQATIALFFTRWITNICAPVFFLLTGTGAYLALRRYSRPELSRFLFTRGLWLIFLEVVVLRCFALQFNFDYHLTMLVVIWALGWAMVLLSALVFLPNAVVTGFGLVMIAAHNLLDPIQAESLERLAPLADILTRRVWSWPIPSSGFCGLSTDSLGGSHGRRIWARPDFRPATRTPQDISVAPRHRLDGRVRRSVCCCNVYGDPASWTRRSPGSSPFCHF